MNLILHVMKEAHLKGGFTIEGNQDFFERMQKLRQMLAQETLMEDEVVEQLADSNRNKVLVVGGDQVVKSLMSSSTTYNPVTYEKELNGGYTFNGCEVYPLHLRDAPHHFNPAEMSGAFVEEEAKDYLPDEYTLSNVFDPEYQQKRVVENYNMQRKTLMGVAKYSKQSTPEMVSPFSPHFELLNAQNGASKVEL